MPDLPAAAAADDGNDPRMRFYRPYMPPARKQRPQKHEKNNDTAACKTDARKHLFYCAKKFTHLALGQRVVDLFHRHVRACEVHVRDQSVLALSPHGQLHGEVGGAAPCAPGKVHEQRLGGLHAPEPVHQILDSLEGVRQATDPRHGAVSNRRY